MKLRSFASLLLAVALADAALGQGRPQTPAPSAPPNRPTVPGARPGGFQPPAGVGRARPGARAGREGAPKAVTQPDGHGAQPVIPYDDSPNALNFQDASADLVIMEYALRTGRTVLKAPNVPQVTITLRTTPDRELSDEQYLRAIREVLALHGIVLKEEGEDFLRVLSAAEAGQHAFRTEFAGADGTFAPSPEDGTVVQRMIELKYITLDEAQPVLTAFLRQGAKIQTIERTNSILVVDSADNVNRVVEILQYMDKPNVVREETHVRHIRYAKAADIKSRLEEFVNGVKEESSSGSSKPATSVEPRSAGAPGVQRRQLPPGVTFRGRADREEEAPSASSESVASVVADAEKGVLRGRVVILADDRTNLLVVFTRKENMRFFDSLIEELDQPTAPETLVEVIRLEHAVAEDMASQLNDLISKTKTSDNDARPGRRDASSEGSSDRPTPPVRAARSSSSSDGDGRTRIGDLDPDNITILADDRSNSLVIKAGASDMAYLREIVRNLDIQLSQVVIEAVILSINFKDTLETGMDWVQRAMIDSAGRNGPGLAFATSGGGGSGAPLATPTLTTVDSIPRSGGINGWITVFDWNTDFILTAVKNDSNAQLMSSPVVLTMDNKEAVLESTERIYWKGEETHYASSDYTSQSIKNEDIGIKLTATPRINNKGYITLTIEQEIQTNDGYTELNGSQYPLLSTRKMGADIAMQSGETVVLGGLAGNSIVKSTTKVPILGSIPLLGWLFRHEVDEQNRSEIIVFITPRVLDTPAQKEDYARGLKSSMETRGVWDPSWSASRLADPMPERAARHVLERGSNTVGTALYPQTGYLTGLNRPDMLDPGEASTGPIQDALDRAAEDGRTPYVHYSDVDRENRLRAATLRYEEGVDVPAGAAPEPAAGAAVPPSAPREWDPPLTSEEAERLVEAAEAARKAAEEEKPAADEPAAADDTPPAPPPSDPESEPVLSDPEPEPALDAPATDA